MTPKYQLPVGVKRRKGCADSVSEISLKYNRVFRLTFLGHCSLCQSKNFVILYVFTKRGKSLFVHLLSVRCFADHAIFEMQLQAALSMLNCCKLHYLKPCLP